MKMPAMILTVMAATLLIAPASPQDGANPSLKALKEQKEELTKKIKELQKERLAILEDLVDAASKFYQAGRIEYGELIAARELLFKAELEAAEKESDRIALYKKMVDVWKQCEQVAKTRKEAARGTEA